MKNCIKHFLLVLFVVLFYLSSDAQTTPYCDVLSPSQFYPIITFSNYSPYTGNDTAYNANHDLGISVCTNSNFNASINFYNLDPTSHCDSYQWEITNINTSSSIYINTSTNYINYHFNSSGSYEVSVIVGCHDGVENIDCNFDAYGYIHTQVFVVDCNSQTDTFPCCENSFAPIPGRKYILGAWAKESVSPDTVNYPDAGISLSFKLTSGNTTLGPFIPKGLIIDGWQRIENEFIVPSDAKDIQVILKNLSSISNNNVFFDDIRIHPFDANMKSFVYDPISLKLVAELDERNYATFYEYDEEGALIRVKKETERGIKTIQESKSSTKKSY